MSESLEVAPDADEDLETPICPRCLEEIFPDTDVCPFCSTPLTFFANTGLLGGAWAEGWGIGQAATIVEPRRIHIIGLWGIVCARMAIPLYLLFVVHGPSFDGSWLGGLEVMGHRVLLASETMLYAWVLYVGTRNWRRRHATIWPHEVFE